MRKCTFCETLRLTGSQFFSSLVFMKEKGICLPGLLVRPVSPREGVCFKNLVCIRSRSCCTHLYKNLNFAQVCTTFDLYYQLPHILKIPYYSLETTQVDHDGTDVRIITDEHPWIRVETSDIWLLHLSHCDRLELFQENSKTYYLAPHNSSILRLFIILIITCSNITTTAAAALKYLISLLSSSWRASRVERIKDSYFNWGNL